MSPLNKKTPISTRPVFSKKTGLRNQLAGFTLVELIVVISILAILGTIAFLSFGGFSSKARDGSRISDTSSLSKGLELYSITAGKYPAPEQITGTGIIGTTEVAYLGTIRDQISTLTKISKTPKDPLSDNYYIYGTTSDYKQYQIATTLENTLSLNNWGESKVYADSQAYSARVLGNYKGLIKFSSGTTNPTTWISNIPSLIYNSGTNLLSQSTRYSVNKSTNLPYTIKDSISGNLTPDEIVKQITNQSTATLTGVQITSLTQTGVQEQFTGALLASFGGDINSLSKIILGSSSVSTTQEETPAPNPPACPSGFIYIPNSIGKILATSTPSKGWCVARYEMTPYDTTGWTQEINYLGWNCTSLLDSNTNPCGGSISKKVVSKSGYNPIINISRNEAEAACNNQLVDQGNNAISGGHLVNVELWSIIAKNIEQQPINWTSGVVGSGNLSRGHANSGPTTTLKSGDDTLWTAKTAKANGNYYWSREWTLSSGDIINDFAGNIWEWFYDLHNSPTCSRTEFTSNNFSYNGISIEPSISTYNSTQGIGQICTVNNIIPTTPNYASAYSGRWVNIANVGIYTSDWDTLSSSANRYGYFGFRCVVPAN